MTYSLFQAINNEAYDEDMKAKREALKRTLEQVKMFGLENSVPRTDLDYSMKLTFTRLFTVFSHEIDKNIQQFHQEALVKDTGNLSLFYNQLASFIDGLNTQVISQTNISVANMIRKMDDLDPKLMQLYEIAQRQNYTDKNIVRDILKNVRDHTYKQVSMKFDAKDQELVLQRAENFQQSVSNADLLLDKVQGLFYLDNVDRLKLVKISSEFHDIKETFILQHQTPNFSSAVAKGKVDTIVFELKRLERKNYDRNILAVEDAQNIIDTKGEIGRTTALISKVKDALVVNAQTQAQGEEFQFAKQKKSAEEDLLNLGNQLIELTQVEALLKDKSYSVALYDEASRKIKGAENLVDRIHDKWKELLKRNTSFKREILTNDQGIVFTFPELTPSPVNAVGLPDDFLIPIPLVEKKKIAPLPMPVMDVKIQTTLIPSQFARIDEENIKNARTQRERDFLLAQAKARKQVLELEKAQRAEQREDDRESAIERQKNLNKMVVAIAKFTGNSKNEIKDQYLDDEEEGGEEFAYNNLKKFYEENVAPRIIEEEGEEREREQEGKEVVRIGRADFEKDRKRILNKILDSDENITKAQLDEELRTATILFKGDEVKALRYVYKALLNEDLGEVVIEGKGKPKKKATHFKGGEHGMNHDGE